MSRDDPTSTDDSTAVGCPASPTLDHERRGVGGVATTAISAGPRTSASGRRFPAHARYKDGMFFERAYITPEALIPSPFTVSGEKTRLLQATSDRQVLRVAGARQVRAGWKVSSLGPKSGSRRVSPLVGRVIVQRGSSSRLVDSKTRLTLRFHAVYERFRAMRSGRGEVMSEHVFS